MFAYYEVIVYHVWLTKIKTAFYGVNATKNNDLLITITKDSLVSITTRCMAS